MNKPNSNSPGPKLNANNKAHTCLNLVLSKSLIFINNEFRRRGIIMFPLARVDKVTITPITVKTIPKAPIPINVLKLS